MPIDSKKGRGQNYRALFPASVNHYIDPVIAQEALLSGKKFRLVLDEQAIHQRVRELANEVEADVVNLNPLVLPILNGSFIFAADFVRELSSDVAVEFVKYTSYVGEHSSGEVRKVLGIDDLDIQGRHVLIVEDIIDTGFTLGSLLDDLKALGARSVRVVAFLFKPTKYLLNRDIDYIGFSIGDAFVVGYGMDYNGLGRSLKGIYQAVGQ